MGRTEFGGWVLSTMRLTCIVDASFCPETKAAAYAIWISGHPDGKITQAGVFKQHCETSTDAEAFGVVNALWLAKRHGGTDVLVQCDCLQALPRGRDIWVRLYPGEAMQFSLRHVKGHTKNSAPRFYVNRWCDKTAKALMRAKRQEIYHGI